MSLAAGMVKACRPKQWAKNVLVVVAPAAAMVYIDRTPDGIEFKWWAVARTLVAFAAFSMVAGQVLRYVATTSCSTPGAKATSS